MKLAAILLGAAYLAGAYLAGAQVNPPDRAEGPQYPADVRVFDSSSGLVVRGARVKLTADGREVAANRPPDASGSVRLRLAPGAYLVEVQAPGYIEAPPVWQKRILYVGPGTRTAALSIPMTRAATVSGRIVDGRSGKPLSSMRAQALLIDAIAGQRTAIPEGKPAVTDSDGIFRIETLPPGEYVLELAPTTATEKILKVERPEYANHALRPMGYGRQWWPAGAGIANPTTLRLSPSQALNLVDIDVTPQPLYHVFGRIGARPCNQGDTYSLEIRQSYGRQDFGRAQALVGCETPFTIANLVPGEYRLGVALYDPKGETLRTSDYQEISIRAGDVETLLMPKASARLSVQIDYPSGFPTEAKSDLEFALRPSYWFFPLRSQTAGILGVPFFRVPFDSNGPAMALLSGLPAPYVVDQVRYNGVEVKDQAIDLDPWASTQALRIQVTDRAAMISGKVTRSGYTASGARVFALPWPLRGRDEYPYNFLTTTDQMGRFTIPQLVAGAYKLIAVSEAGYLELQKPGALSLLAAGAQQVDLQPGALREISVELSWIAGAE